MSKKIFTLILFLVLLKISTVQAANISYPTNIENSAFYPCNTCHPINATGKAMPHKIELKGHDKLGEGRAACLTCHDSAKNPALLKLQGRKLGSIEKDVPELCYQCHERRYYEWKDGMHGKPPKCTTEGCHSPHTPRMDKSVAEKVVGAKLPLAPVQSNPPPPPDVLYKVKISAIVALIGVAAAIVGPAILMRRRRG